MTDASMTMLSKAALKMLEPKEGYGGFSEELAALPKKRVRTQAVTPEIDYDAPQMGTSRATVVKLEHPKELKPPASVTNKPKGKGKASGAAPAPALARAQPLAKKTEKAERTVAEAADSETVAALKAQLAKQEAVLATTRTERTAFQESSQLNSALAEAREEEKQHLEEDNVAKDKTIKKLQGLLTVQTKNNVELKRRLETSQAAGKTLYKKYEKLMSQGKRKRDDEELSQGEIDEDEEEEEDSGDDSGDDPTYDEEEGQEQEEEDDEEEEEEAEQERAITVFAKHNSSKRLKASSSSDCEKGDGKRKGGRLNKADKILYDRPSTAFEACGGLPVHNIKEIPYLFQKKPNLKNMPAWKTQEEMVAWVRLEYQNEDKKDSHAPGMVEDMLDLFAVPNPGTTYYAKKDFTACIKYFATWSLPESEGKTGLSGGRHFMGTLLYPDFFKPQRSSFIRHKFKDTYEQKKFLALREKVNKYWGCIWWWNKHLKLGHPQRKVN